MSHDYFKRRTGEPCERVSNGRDHREQLTHCQNAVRRYDTEVSFRLSRKLRDAAAQAARESRVSRSELLRHLLRVAIEARKSTS
jgi:hypothetical protein